MTYQVIESDRQPVIIKTKTDGTTVSFGRWPDNIDYQQFKTDLQAGAELQDSDGNLMTAEQVAGFLATLP